MLATPELARARALLTLIALCGLGLGLPACKKAGSEGSAPAEPDALGADQATSAEASGDPLAELAALERRMQELGLQPAARARGAEPGASADAEPEARDEGFAGGEVAADKAEEAEAALDEDRALATESAAVAPAAPPDVSDGAQRCADLCGLSESICELEGRICALASGHDGDRSYVDACERASDDCELAGAACQACAG